MPQASIAPVTEQKLERFERTLGTLERGDGD